jgi:Uma2 family endonuclease
MSTIPLPDVDVIQIAPLHRFSSADYLDMIEKGVLGPDDHVELIGGVIVEMSPAGTPHNGFLICMLDIFGSLLDRHHIAVQGTLTVLEGQVYDPDFLLLTKRADHYRTKLPDASDVLLVIEAADSSLHRDQKVKLPVYATAGIQEYWIADLKREVLIVHRSPESGAYKSVQTLQGDDVVSPLAAPDLTFAVRQAFE